MKVFSLLLLLSGFIVAAGLQANAAQQRKRPFTVADDIGLTLPRYGEGNVRFSPDGNYFAVYSKRGRLDVNKVEDSLRFYRSQDVENFLAHPEEASAPAPVWTMSRAAKEVGVGYAQGVIDEWRWVADSSGVDFVERMEDGNKRLFLADLRRKAVEPLTSEGEDVQEFDMSDRQHYVYTSADPAEWKRIQEKKQWERKAPALVGTGRDFDELLFPDNPLLKMLSSPPSHLWAFAGGRHFEVKRDGAAIVPEGGLALSPDGRSAVTALPVASIPPSWETLYPPPYPGSPDRLHAGGSAPQYVRIDLKTSSVEALTDAPTGAAAGWWWAGSSPQVNPSWSSDGQAILLPGTFVESKEHVPARPCIAVVDLPAKSVSCVEPVKARSEEVVNGHTEVHHEEGFRRTQDIHFVGAGKRRVGVVFQLLDDSLGITEYQRAPSGVWQPVQEIKGDPEIGRDGLQIGLKQAFNEPPLLVASGKKATRVIWDMNPQLKSIEMGEGSVFRWKDKEGRELKGGLYNPIHYQLGRRYPLVIHTHGFNESYFSPSGAFTTAFAAEELAGADIMVLQMLDGNGGTGCRGATPEEGPCAVSAYESAVNQLAADGLVDPEKVGIIGFSRSCLYAMQALTFSSLHFRAASVTDGVMLDYFQGMQMPERFLGEGSPMIGAAPLGEGLQQWFKKSPGFNFDRINTPLMVVATGSESLLLMWHPYAELHYLKKPVDLIVLNSGEHVITNPAERMASQGGSVDWFRFWLQGYEDPDPAKVEQYKRWRELRKLQESDKNQQTSR